MSKIIEKHQSKLYKGLIKQVRRQDAKPLEVTINLPPIAGLLAVKFFLTALGDKAQIKMGGRIVNLNN